MERLHFAEDLDLPLGAITQKFAIFAQSGAGKSYAGMRLAEEMLRVGAQIVVLDPVGPWHGLRIGADGASPGYPIAVLGGQRGDLPLPPDAGEAVADALAGGAFSAVLDLSEFTLPEHKRFVRAFAERFFQRKKETPGPVHLFLEEAQVFAPLRPDSDETTMLNRVELLARIGRNYGIGWTVISQRPQDVHTKVRNQAGTLITLRTIGTHERKAIGDWVADKAQSEEEAALMASLPKLETGDAILWSPAWLKAARRVRVAARVTYDSSRTPEFGEAIAAPRTLAAVDVAALREALAATIAAVERDDPAVLRGRVADLEAKVRRQQQELDARPKPVVVAQPVEVPVEVPVLRERDLARLEEVIGVAERLAPALDRALVELRMTLDDMGGRIDAARTAPTPPAPVDNPPPAVDNTPPRPPAAAPSPRPSGGTVALKAGARRILEVLAHQHPLRFTRAQIGTLADLTPSGGSFLAYLGSLKAGGLVDESGGDLGITPQGFAYLGVPPRSRPMGGAELVAYWRAALPSDTQRRMLDALVAAYPQGLDVGALADAVGMSGTGGAFNGHVGLLRRNGLAEKVGTRLRAGAMLFGARG